MIEKRKVVLVGTGFVGMSMAYAIVNQGIGVNELVLIDVLKDKAIGEAMDLSDGIPCSPSHMVVKSGEYSECKDADIVVITGHDSLVKQNSKYFKEAVKVCRRFQKDYDKLIIIAGACQSEYDMLIKAGANFASSPKKVNIHALDPAIIALTLSLLDKTKEVDLIELLDKTSNGKDGMGGVNTRGVMTTGYPR